MRPLYLTDQNDGGPKPDRSIEPGKRPEEKAGGGPAKSELPKNDPSIPSG